LLVLFCGGLRKMALLHSQHPFELVGDPNTDQKPAATIGRKQTGGALYHHHVSCSPGSNVSMNLDAAIPQVIVMIEQHWGFDALDNEEEHNTTASSMVAPEQPSRPSEATIQVLRMFFDGIEDQMDVEDELLFGRPEETSSIVSDLSVVTTCTGTCSSSTSDDVEETLEYAIDDGKT
jgi:hypothetical protein